MWRKGETLNPLCYNDLQFSDRSPCDKDTTEASPPVDSALVAPTDKMKNIFPEKMFERSLFSCKLMPLESQSDTPAYKRQAVESSAHHRAATSFVYKTRAPRRGTCLVISVDTFKAALGLPSRPGADVDLKKLEDTFLFLDFDVKTYQNPSATQILSIVETESSANHADADCFACVILTHGDDAGSIYGTDGPVPLDQVIHPFRGNTCPSLAGKPKMFFIQACRGAMLDSGTLVSTDSSGGPGDSDTLGGLRRIPIEADLLVAYAVQPGKFTGYYAFRNSVHGSWFIQALNNCLRKYGRILDLMSIMTRVNYEVAFEFESLASTAAYSGKKQVPSIVSTLTKDVFFPPKTTAPSTCTSSLPPSRTP
ncbi:Caspase-3 [Echinococcus granulosus]|uniref:Caspase n=2 Tax=Echinococcus granulosus TaxID=6210 RepID=A0A068WCU2_ECHGR|nr:Caspase-3 [Echinococcus granulosus]CDS17893.1 caspase [Echinococcus granulosus]